VPMTRGFKNISIEHVYIKSLCIVQLQRKRPRNFDITNVGYESYMHCVQGTVDEERTSIFQIFFILFYQN
jgi:hypothetical protein